VYGDTCDDVYNKALPYDDIYLTTPTTTEKLTLSEFKDILNSHNNPTTVQKQTRGTHKLFKRGNAYGSPGYTGAAAMPSTKYEFNWERSFSGYGFPVKGPTNIHCNLPLGCEQTITDTITTSTTLSLSADIHINAGALFCGILDAANINIGHTTSREISKSISLKWNMRNGDSGSIGIYPWTKFVFGTTTKISQETIMIEGKFYTYTIGREKYTATISIPEKNEVQEKYGIQTFFFN
jgi:hypothetical protein